MEKDLMEEEKNVILIIYYYLEENINIEKDGMEILIIIIIYLN